MRLVGYIRVSTDRQAKDGFSLDAQCRKVSAYCEMHEHTLVDVISDEGQSGKSLVRPGLRSALMMLRVGEADGLVVAKLDRLTRSVVDIGELIVDYFSEAKGKSLHSVGDMIDTSSPTGRMIINILTSVAQWEREAIAERVRDGLAEAMRQGAVPGQLPYGLRRGDDTDEHGRRRIMVDERDSAAILTISELHEAGHSVRAICYALHQAGVQTKRGKTWHSTQVQRIIQQIRTVKAAA